MENNEIDRKDSLSIALPIFNEEKNIRDVITDVIANIHSYINDFEIIVVDDGSVDKSLAIINKLSVECPELRVIRNYKNRGVGFALRRGIDNAQKEWLFILDADGQFRVGDFKSFWNKRILYDFIIGYREKRMDNAYRRILGKLGNFIANLFFGPDINVKDINCGFKLFKRYQLKKISLRSTGGIINFEILSILSKEKRIFAQLPVTHYKRRKGKASGGNPKTIMKIIFEAILLFFRRKD